MPYTHHIINTKSNMAQDHLEVETIRCPYIPEHVMHRDSLRTHLLRCPATNKHMFEICEYNCEHVVPKAEIVSHYEECYDYQIVKEKRRENGFEDEEDDASWINQKGPIIKKPGHYRNDKPLEGQRHDLDVYLLWKEEMKKNKKYPYASGFEKKGKAHLQVSHNKAPPKKLAENIQQTRKQGKAKIALDLFTSPKQQFRYSDEPSLQSDHSYVQKKSPKQLEQKLNEKSLDEFTINETSIYASFDKTVQERQQYFDCDLSDLSIYPEHQSSSHQFSLMNMLNPGMKRTGYQQTEYYDMNGDASYGDNEEYEDQLGDMLLEELSGHQKIRLISGMGSWN